MLGTLDEAQDAALMANAYGLAHSYDDKSNYWECVEKIRRAVSRKPEAALLPGWKYLGAGVDRTAWLSPSGVVYKVTHYSVIKANAQEWQAAAYFLANPLPVGFGVPQMSKYDVEGFEVLAAEFIDGPEAWGDEFAAAYFGTTDTHSGNMRRRGGILYCIDLGFFDAAKVNMAFQPYERESESSDWPYSEPLACNCDFCK